MQIQASVGNAPRSATLDDTVYKLTLTAQSKAELKYLSELFKAVREHGVDPYYPNMPLRIVEKYKDKD